MDVVGECLCLIPVPGLSTVFIIFRFIVSTIEQAQSSKQQLQALSRTLADLLQALNSAEGVSAGHLDALRRLLDEISAFVHKHASYGFLKAIYTKDRRIAQIEAYQNQIAALIDAFQITALLRIQNAQAINEAARARDQQALIDRLSALEANHASLAENLNVQPGNIQAIMASIDSNLEQKMGDPERRFLSYTLQYLRTSSGTQVARDAWTITSYDVDIGQRIGSGGYAEVFKAIWNLVEVAVKIFRIDNGIVPPTSASIRREIQVWSKLRHPHLLQFLGANVLDDNPFIVMPLFNNGNALDYLELHPNCNRTVVLHQMSLGLVHLHAHNVVHGDLKAANVLIDDSGKAVLCDFGLSRVISNITSRSTVADSSLCAGSRNWMSPERLSGGSLRKPADIYAFGMTIFEIHANEVPLGDVPYAEFTDLVVRRNVRPERPHAEDAPQLSDDIWRLAEDCWVRDPLVRPTAPVLCSVIGQLVESTPNPAPRNTSEDAGSEGDAITTLVARFRTVISPPLPLDADIIWLLQELQNHGRASDLDFCVTYWSEAIELLYNDPLRKAYALLGLGASQSAQAGLRSDLAGLDTSILTLQSAIELFTTENQHKADAYLALGAAQLERFALCSDQPDLNLDSPISNIQRALDLYPINCSNAGIASIFLCALKVHPLYLDQIDPTSMVSSIENAFKLLPEGHPFRPSALQILGVCNFLQFQRSSELLHLDASISNFRKAAQQLSLKKQPEVLGILGITYLERYRLRKETPDLDAAISNLRKATELQVENNEMQASHFHQMGLAFHNRFKLYQELPDIDRAISHMRKATELHTESTRRIEAFLSLGILFLDRYNLRHLLPDSDASILNLQKAVEICPDNHHSRPVVFYWLGWSHYRRFHLLRRVPGVDSEAAVANLERAVASSQASNPEHATYVKALSEAKEGHSPSLANQVWNGFRDFMFVVKYN